MRPAAIPGSELDYPADTPLIELFDGQVEENPDRDALIVAHPDGGADRLTYRDLADREAWVSSRLARLGVRPGKPLLGRLRRGPQALVALLAACRARAAYVPLDAAHPQHLVDAALADTGATVVLAGTEPIPQRIGGGPEVPLPDVALVMYTSGTTSRPKAVLHAETQLRNRMHWMWHEYPWQPGEVACQRSPLGVMPSMWEFLGGLLRGVPTVLLPDPVAKDTRLFLRALAEHRVSRLTVTPSVLRMMLDEPTELRPVAEHVRTMIIGGEHFSPELVRRMHAALPDTTLINDYGCTEVNTILHAAWIPQVLARSARDGLPGGCPVANLRVWLLDEDLRPVPDGDTGELCVQGPAVAHGYLNRDADTAAKFVTGPGGARVYRTGDLARKEPDGTVRLLGRLDNQLKVNGMRIEPEGVESVLTESPSVREAVVTPRDLASGARQLHARLVPENGAGIELDEVRALLAQKLPSYAVPATFETIAELPRNSRGKVDRRALGPARPGAEANAAGQRPASAAALSAGLVDLLATEVLERDPATVDPERDFYLLGLDSVLTVRFARLVGDRYGVDLGVADLYDKPNLTALTDYLWQRLRPAQAPRATVSTSLPRHPERVSREHGTDREDAAGVAVIGYSGRFPQAPDAEALWELIVHGREAVDVVPADRWDAEAVYDPQQRVGGSISKWGAFLADADGFEPLFFGIAPAEAALMDPQQRLALQEGWRALEHAGYSVDRLGGQSVGVFVGAKKGDYGNGLPRDADIEHGAALLGNDAALTAARLAYHLDLHGPCLTVDTACSSSLTALHLARQSLLDGECDLALVGGVCVVTDPHFYVSTSRLGIFSPTGHTRPFDDEADGFVQGEGVVFVVLRRLSDALPARDTVHGVLRATAINQDGRTNGIGAPSATAQSALEQRLYRRHRIDPAAIGYLEAHGTGTKVGDPIEVAALTEAFRQFTAERQFCALGSVKANIGHLTAAAGLAGLVKLLLCLRHATVPPLANLNRPNEHLNLADSPFYLPRQAQPWPAPAAGPRVAALSSFGLGGCNAHCVLEEPPTPYPPEAALRPAYPVPLGARTEESARRLLADLHDLLERTGPAGQPNLRDLSFTLLAGRRQFPNRHVLLARDLADLTEQLRGLLRSTAAPSPPRGNLTVLDEEFGRFLVTVLGDRDCAGEDYRAKLDALAELMRRGFQPDPEQLFRAEQPHRIPLPTYPFRIERFWLTTPAATSNGHQPPRPRTGAERTDQVVAETVADLLGVPADALDRRAELTEYGMDSIKAVTLKHRLEHRLRIEVAMEAIGTSGSVEELAAKLTTANAARDPLVDRLLGGNLALDAADEGELDRLFELVEGNS